MGSSWAVLLFGTLACCYFAVAAAVRNAIKSIILHMCYAENIQNGFLSKIVIDRLVAMKLNAKYAGAALILR